MGRLLERHLATTKEWFPHELVPYSRGRDFERGTSVAPGRLRDRPRRRGAQLALREPPHRGQPARTTSATSTASSAATAAWGDWARRWTAEEGRHSIVIRDYLTVSRAIDPVALERGRMAQVSKGEVPAPTAPSTASCTSRSRSSRRGSRIATRARCSTIPSATSSWLVSRRTRTTTTSSTETSRPPRSSSTRQR